MSEHLKLDCLLIEPITEPDSILLGITLNPAISLVNINGRAHSPNSVVHQILLVPARAHKVYLFAPPCIYFLHALKTTRFIVI